MTRDYTVLIPFPTGGGHWAETGETVALLDVEAAQLLRVDRIEPKAASSDAKTPKNGKPVKQEDTNNAGSR